MPYYILLIYMNFDLYQAEDPDPILITANLTLAIFFDVKLLPLIG